jgi:Winged helix-turn helix/DDE superfamily endonuclease
VTLLGQGALHAGYRTELWTIPRVAELIRDEFGVRYHPAHVWKLLTALGWSCQKPERRAVERDEAAIARWKREDWPRIKKAARRGAHLVFVDESGFLLIPNVRRTWAPRGQTPCVRHRYRHDRLSVCSGVAVSPKRRRVALYLRCRPRILSGLDIRAFLQHLLRHLRGPVDLLWDRGPIHRRREVRTFLAAHPRLAVHDFPRTHRSSIPPSTCGRRPTMISPTAHQTISASSANASMARPVAFVAPNRSCGPASTPRTCHGRAEAFHIGS